MFFLKALVETQFNGARLGLSVLFFLLPTILWSAFLLAFGFTLNWQGIGLSVALGAVNWAAVSFVLLLLKAFKGRGSKAGFSQVLSALSVNYLIAAAVGLIVFLLVFISVPGFLEKVSSLQGKDVTQQEMVSVVESLALPSDVVLLVVFALIGLVVLAGWIAGVYVLYRIGQLARETSRFSNWVFTVLGMGLTLAVHYALQLVLGYLLAL